MKLLSVNTGSLRNIPWAETAQVTGIFKNPVSGTVRVGVNGLQGDNIGSVKYHGGPDQAVYIYSREDYLWWSQKLGR